MRPPGKREVASVLARLAFAYELLDEPYKARAFNGAVWPIRSLDEDLRQALQSGRLSRMRGVGSAVVRVVQQVLAGQEPPELADLEERLPAGVLALRRVRGLGPKKVKALWKDLGVASLAELEYACTENRLVALSGFGQKTQDKVLASVQQLRAAEGRFTRDRVRAVHDAVVPGLREACERVIAVGSWRRGEELVDGLDLLVVGDAQVPDQVDGVPLRVQRSSAGRFGTDAILATGPQSHLDALGELIEAPHEAEVYAALGWHVTPPELRGGGRLVPLAEPRPPLLRRADLLGALHNHTTASDGRNSLAEMKAGAEAQGLTYLGISEHSQTASYAGGLSVEALLAQTQAIAALNAQGGCQLLTGIESDILRDGSLDYERDVLEGLDVVVASVHNRHGQGGEAMTERMVRAVPRAHLIGHPTGRLLLGRPPTDVDVAALLAACAESGTAIELNASAHRLDLHERHLAMARERGVLVAISPDAHSVRELANLDFGVSIARRAGLRPQDVLNTRPLGELRAWLAG